MKKIKSQKEKGDKELLGKGGRDKNVRVTLWGGGERGKCGGASPEEKMEGREQNST